MHHPVSGYNIRQNHPRRINKDVAPIPPNRQVGPLKRGQHHLVGSQQLGAEPYCTGEDVVPQHVGQVVCRNPAQRRPDGREGVVGRSKDGHVGQRVYSVQQAGGRQRSGQRGQPRVCCRLPRAGRDGEDGVDYVQDGIVIQLDVLVIFKMLEY